MSRFWKTVARGAAMLALAGAAMAQAPWPNRPVKFIVPFPPGGSTDALVRAIAPRVGELLGQPIVVDYKSGAGGSIGLDAVAKAPPDGYTIGLGSPGALMAVPHLSKVPYDVNKDFAFVTRLARVPAIIVTSKTSPITSAREMIERAKAAPGKLNFGHAGRGTLVHLSGELFKAEAGLNITPVAYRGAAPAMQGLMGNEIELLVADLTAVWGALQQDQLRPLAVTSAQRSPLLPQVPTVAELGFPRAVYESDYGVVAPAGVPADIQARLVAAFGTALGEKAIQEAYLKIAAQPSPSTPAEYRQTVVQGSAFWGDFIRAHKIIAD